MKHGTFVDWITASQHHPDGGLPVITGGFIVQYNASGVPRFERNCATGISGSYATGVRVGCDGFRVSLSGNAGRFSRPDNLFNHGIAGTIAACNRILSSVGLPAFTAGGVLPSGEKRRGCVVSRLDITGNFSTGNEAQARALIRWLSSRSLSRMKKGLSGDDSVWWSNSRHMVKAYIKHLELLKHGGSKASPAVEWCALNGVVRVEVELKKRLLSELGLNDLGNITDDALHSVFVDQTSILRAVDRSDDPDVLSSIPQRSRAYASAWLAGQDVRSLCSRATLFRHAQVLREYGIDILENRTLSSFPVRVRVIDLQPVAMPAWYLLVAA